MSGEYVNFGRAGVKVSRLAGCGPGVQSARHAERGDAGDRARHRLGHQPDRLLQLLRPGRRGDALGGDTRGGVEEAPRQPGDHLQGVHADRAGAQRPRLVSLPRDEGGRAVAATAGHRPHRRLPAPRVRRGNAARRDAAGDGRPDHAGQGAVCRVQQLRRLAGVQGALDGRPARRRPDHLRAEPVQPAQSGHRERPVRRGAGPGPGGDGVQSAGRGAAERRLPHRSGSPGGARYGRARTGRGSRRRCREAPRP